MTKTERELRQRIIALEELVDALQEAWDGYDPDGLVEAAEDKVMEVLK